VCNRAVGFDSHVLNSTDAALAKPAPTQPVNPLKCIFLDITWMFQLASTRAIVLGRNYQKSSTQE
jgi:hypothetical protein